MRPPPVILQLHLLLCVFFGAYGSGGVVIHSLPWHVSCPGRCACQIKPWFSPESVYHEAPTVDCNDLQLKRLPLPLPHDTHTLRLQSNLLSSLDDSLLHVLPNLTEVDLSQNRFNSIRKVTQSSVLPSLLSLHLEENQLHHLPDASFSSYPALQELFLSHNRLRILEPGVFTGLDSLLRLHLNNNRLASINPQWFTALPNLEVLMLGGNPVEALTDQGFQALKSLRSLVLGGMGLRVLPEKALDGLDGLESLSFYDNLLTTVPTQALKRVPGLKFLDLNKNRIKLVQTGDFKDMIHLKELGLNNLEELVSIERASLENLPELTKLEITNNPRLSYIHPEAFHKLHRLESLMLNSNSLTALHQHTLLSLPSLQEVSLHSNPLRCDCLFRWAAETASHQHVDTDPQCPDLQVDKRVPRVVRFIQPQSTLCSEPPELRARRVKEVSTREMSMSCLPLIPRGPLPAYMGVREGDSLALHCRALAEPQPKLYWVTPSGLKLGPTPVNASNPAVDPSPHPRPADSQGSQHTHHSPNIHSPNAHSTNVHSPNDHSPNVHSTNVHSPNDHSPNVHSSNNHSPNVHSTNDHSPNRPQESNPSEPSSQYRLLPEGTLEITAVTSKEVGLYTCIAENELGADTRSVTVEIHGRKRKGDMAAHLRKYHAFRAGTGLEVREVGHHYAVLSWNNGHNLPSARLSWQAIYTDTHMPTYTTRILAGTQSFNLSHLQTDTFYRVCLHLAIGEGFKHGRGRGSSQSQCVSFRTKEAVDVESSLPLSPELTSTALAMLLLALILLLLASQGWSAEPGNGEGKHGRFLTQQVKGHEVNITEQKKDSSEKQHGLSEKVSLQQHC